MDKTATYFHIIYNSLSYSLTLHNSLLRTKACQLTAGLMPACQKTEVNNNIANKEIIYSQNDESPRFYWLPKPELLLKISLYPNCWIGTNPIVSLLLQTEHYNIQQYKVWTKLNNKTN